MPIPWYLLLALAYATIILTYRRAWKRVVPFTVPEGFVPRTAISIIVPARNEEENIVACVRSVLAQDYPTDLFELIVVDDFSTDGTASKVMEIRDGRLRLLRLRELPGMDAATSSKKKALTQGIALARHGLIVTTDADCTCPPRWLRTLSAWYGSRQPSFLAAPVRFAHGKGLLQVFQSLDFMVLQGITIAAASNGLHVMSNGANLGYEKAVFDALGGFSGVDHIASGDDMLLQQKFIAHDPGRVSYCTAADAIVSTRAAGSWTEFLRQRIRWASKAAHYKSRGLLAILLVVYGFNMLMLVLPFFAFADPRYLWQWAGLLLIKVLVELTFLVPVARFFGRARQLWWFLPLQPLHILYTVAAGAFGQFRTYEWKGRKVK